MSSSVASKSLKGTIALVTGGSRGIGKGVAQHLIQSGADVFITGRNHGENSSLPNVYDTAEELNKLNFGKCHPIFCDHSKDQDIDALFKEIENKYQRLNILVNNAFSGGEIFADITNKNFWQTNPSLLWEKVIDGGLKSNYICSTKAAQLMIPKRSGLIVNISSIGGLIPVFGTLYSMGKNATDTMTANMGIALKPYNVSIVSLWPGIVKTERSQEEYNKGNKQIILIISMWAIAEDPTLVGKAVECLYLDDNLILKSGRIHLVADLAHKYNFKDVGGVTPTSFRSLRFAVYQISPTLSKIVPNSIKAPGSLLSAVFNNF